MPTPRWAENHEVFLDAEPVLASEMRCLAANRELEIGAIDVKPATELATWSKRELRDHLDESSSGSPRRSNELDVDALGIGSAMIATAYMQKAAGAVAVLDAREGVFRRRERDRRHDVEPVFG
ncbi:hypothetical protein QMK17_03940 [Rhodococcus sp. G-MC3]|uniref:hypothetical protein n=1 Tax=Rhodococcus sp. G-MC3 TaxID=3046209 RepID=UPI0024BA9914|nr:hypothetical protein [Rhodococcus sp. G-MC3]MDJ0392484.1 hypothetical protein [Rhodococcus sp. G-MC3]